MAPYSFQRETKMELLDNLVEAPHVMLAATGDEPIVLLDRFPKSFDDFKFLLRSLKTAYRVKS
jgi:hypothetical protein